MRAAMVRLGAGLAAASLAACSPAVSDGNPARLRWTGEPGDSYSNTTRELSGRPLVFEELFACSRSAEKVHIVAVEAAAPSAGFVVTGWGYLAGSPYTSPHDSIYHRKLDQLSGTGFHLSTGPVEMDYPCSIHVPRLTLALEAHWSSAGDAWTNGVRIRYVSEGGTPGIAVIPGSLGICAEDGPRRASQLNPCDDAYRGSVADHAGDPPS